MTGHGKHTDRVRLRTALLTYAFFLGVMTAFPATGQESPAEQASWTPWAMNASEIQSTGAVRLSELFRMMPAVETWSPDRYTQRFLGTGIGGMHPAGPAVYLDGVALPALFLDRVLTESLPVSPGDLEAVAWLPGVHVMPGGRLSEGRMMLRTPMLRGWEASGAMAVINETGDPGPAKHTDARLENVDRSGPASWLRAGWGNGRWMVQAGLQTDLHHLTDDRISGRVRRTYAEIAQPVVTQFSPFVRIRYEGHRWQGHLLSGHSRRKGFTFHESAGWEWPSRLRRSWAAGRLAGRLDPVRVVLDIDASRLETGVRPAFIDLPPTISTQEASGKVSVEADAGWLEVRAGVGVRTSELSQAGLELTRTMPSAHLRLGRASPRWRTHLSVEILHVPGVRGRDASLSSHSEWVLAHDGPDGGFHLDLGYLQGPFPEPGLLTEWAQAGLDMAGWMSLPALDEQLSSPRSLDLGVTGYRAFTGNWTGWVEGRLRWMDGQLFPDRTINQPFGIGPMLPVWEWSSPHSGWLFSRSLGVQRLDPEAIVWRAFLQFHHVSSEGDDVFFRHQTGFPRHRLWISASEERDGGVSWTVRAGYLSEWTWPEYLEPARRSVPADIVLDATVGKSLFSGYIKTFVSLLNLPDRALGVHPAGVEEQLAIRLTLSFSSERRFSSSHSAGRTEHQTP